MSATCRRRRVLRGCRGDSQVFFKTRPVETDVWGLSAPRRSSTRPKCSHFEPGPFMVVPT